MTTTTVDRWSTVDPLVNLAGWAVIAGALLQIVCGIPLAAFEEPDSPAFGTMTTLNVLNHLLLIAGVAGLARSEAAGRGRLAFAGLAVALSGLGILTLAEPTALVNMGVAEVLYSISTPLIALGLILVGATVVRARRWTGWRRFTPLACGLFIPLVLIPSFALPGLAFHYAIGIWGVCWLLLGLSLRDQANVG